MATQGFVSKNDRIEKADRKKDQPWLMLAGNIVPILQSLDQSK
jgi:hypothetical protein